MSEEQVVEISPKCIQCEKTDEVLMWRNFNDAQICNDCFLSNRDNLRKELEPEISNNNGEEKKIRKSTRTTRFKSKSNVVNKGIIPPKGKSRRCIFKKSIPFKSPTVPCTTTTCDNLFYNGTYFQTGDIVSLIDTKENIYYGQIRGLMVDIYCEKSAFITWLIPTKSSPPANEKFDSSTYLIGPDEDVPRKLSCMQFVMNAPSTYFYNRNNPYPAPDSNHTKGFFWKNIVEVD